MMVKIINPTDEVVKCVTRLNLKWFDGVQPGQVIEVDEEKKVVAFLKHGCKIVPEVKKEKKVKSKIKTKSKPKKEVEE